MILCYYFAVELAVWREGFSYIKVFLILLDFERMAMGGGDPAMA